MSAYIKHLQEVATASDERSRMFCDHLSSVAVFGAIDPVDNGWLDEFLTRSALREKMHWAGGVTQVLREADNQAKESVWNRWIKRYLRRRVQATPFRSTRKIKRPASHRDLTMTTYALPLPTKRLCGLPARDVLGTKLLQGYTRGTVVSSAWLRRITLSYAGPRG
jgi:hypothetical protein